MKKQLLLLILVFSFLSAKAQNIFAPIGAEWWYASNDGFGNQGIHFLLNAKSTHDTLIDGISCRVIEQSGIIKTSFLNNWPPTYSIADTVVYKSLYVYNNADTVFIYNDFFDRFTPLYIYNVVEGQTVCLPAIPSLDGFSFNSSALIDSSYCYVIDSIRNVVYDTTTIKSIFTHALYDSINHPTMPNDQTKFVMNWSHADYKSVGVYTQVFGGGRGGILPKYLYFRGIFDGTDATASMNLRCYNDHLNNIKLGDVECDYLPQTTSIFDKETAHLNITIYPNPASEFITIQRKMPMFAQVAVQVTDLSGRIIKEEIMQRSVTKQSIDLSQLNKGMYFIKLIADGTHYYQKIVLER